MFTHITNLNSPKIIHINFINTATIPCQTDFYVATYNSLPVFMLNVYINVIFILYYRQYLRLKVQFYLISPVLYEIVWIVASCTEYVHVMYYMKNMHYCEELKNDGKMLCALYVVMFYIHIS
jgi:hypothetical protein